jgi:hypothetical protein
LPRAPLFPSPPTANDKEKRFANLWTPERNLQQILSLHLVCLQGRKRNKERKTWARVLMAEFKFEFESFRKELEKPPNSFQRFLIPPRSYDLGWLIFRRARLGFLGKSPFSKYVSKIKEKEKKER